MIGYSSSSDVNPSGILAAQLCAGARDRNVTTFTYSYSCILLSFYFKLIYGYNKRVFYFFQFNMLHVVHYLLIHDVHSFVLNF